MRKLSETADLKFPTLPTVFDLGQLQNGHFQIVRGKCLDIIINCIKTTDNPHRRWFLRLKSPLVISLFGAAGHFFDHEIMEEKKNF